MDRFADELLDRLLQGPRAERLVNATPDEKRIVGDRQIETALSKPRQFLDYGEPGDFALSVRGKRLEDDKLVKAPDEFRAEEHVQFRNDRPLSSVVNGSRVGRRSCREPMLLVHTT